MLDFINFYYRFFLGKLFFNNAFLHANYKLKKRKKRCKKSCKHFYAKNNQKVLIQKKKNNLLS